MKTRFAFAEYFKRDNATKLMPYVEVLLICIWGIWVGRALLDFNVNNIPWGREYGMAISTHHLWSFVKECGWCAVWDGSQIGGYPALANTYAAILHPITMITTLIWEVVNGSKIIIVLSLIFAGIAQWWLAHELKLGRVARLWGAILVIVCGHLAGKLELGVVDIILSTAMCSLVFPAILLVARRQDWHSVVVLGLIASSAVLSGQGYSQVLLVISLPALGFLLLDGDWQFNPLWKKYAVAAGLVILMTAVLTIPVIANGWNIHKGTNPNFDSVQPLKYSLLNFVIDDFGYFKSDALYKWANPSLYINFVGWLPIILAIFAVGAAKEADRKRIYYLAGSTALIIGIVDVHFLTWVAHWLPFIASVRFPTFGLGIAVPAIIGLASYGLDRILTDVKWPSVQLGLSPQNSNARALSIPLSLILLAPIVINIQQAYVLGQITLNLQPLWPGVVEKLEAMKTKNAEWVLPVLGEQFWTEPAVRIGLKVTNESLPFWTGVKHYPDPHYILSREPLTDPTSVVITNYGNETLYLLPTAEYAIVTDGTGNTTICASRAVGGNVDVSCDAPTNGTLIVHENIWPGWKAWIDGKKIALTDSDGWLSVNTPAGKHNFSFRYRPWDVPLGLVLSILGFIACGWLWFRPIDELPAST